MRKKCPFCGSRNTAKYIYGLPALDEKMEKKLANGEWRLGGCMIFTVDVNGENVQCMPTMHCNECGKDFGEPPILFSKKLGEGKGEDYRDIVTSICFSISDFSQGNMDVTVIRNADGAVVKAVCFPSDLEEQENKQITVKDWKKLVNALYSQIYLHEWKKRYVNPEILDGVQWELQIRLTGKRQRSYYGSNEYPPYWKELKAIFQKYAKLA